MKKGRRKIPWYLLLTFLVLSLSIWAVGYSYYSREKESIQRDKQEDLLAIADLKVQQIADWRRERLSDGEIISQDPFFTLRIREWFQKRDPELKQKILSRMQSFRRDYQYRSLVLLDSGGEIHLVVPEGKESLGPDARQLTLEAMRTGKTILSDLYQSRTHNLILLTIVVPLADSAKPAGTAAGALLLRVDPSRFLYPLIQSWPTPSASAETIMVRREGNDVVFLNELRQKKHTALTLRFPVSAQKLPAALAVHGREGIVEGIDYRGIPVITAIKRVPDSPWFLIAKVDQEEIYAPIRQRLWTTTLLVSIMILGAGGFIGLFWWHQQATFYQERYKADLNRLALLQHFEYLTKYANDIILLSDERFRVIEANERASISYGYAADELVGLFLKDLRAPETRHLLEQQIKEAKSRNGLVYETIHQRKDGTRFPVEVSARLLEIEGKKFYQHIVRDVTERKQAEDALRESEQKFKNIVEHSNELFYIHDTRHKLTYISPQAIAILGYTPEEMITEWTNLVTDNPINEQGIQITELAIQSGKKQRPYLLELYRKDGGKVLLEIDESPLMNDEGAVTGIVGAARNVTEQKNAEEELKRYREHLEELVQERTAELELANRQLQTEIDVRITVADALRASEEKYRSIVDNIGIGIALISPGMEILSLNRQMKEWFPSIDTERRPICYRAFNTPPRSEVCTYCPTWKTLQDGTVHMSITETPGTGGVRNYRIIASPIRDKNEQIVAAIEMVEDITEIKRAEEKIIRLNQELQYNIAQLENTNKELESFSYSVSHDLRAPLRSIDGFSRVLLEDYGDKFDEEGRNYLNRVRNASQRMGQLIDDLLSLSRVSRREMRHEMIDLSALVNTLAEELQGLHPERQMAWSIQPGIIARGDAGLLRILFENLLGNAIKFTGRKKVAEIEFLKREDQGEEVYCIRDNGAGFDMSYSDKLFGAFQRLHSQDEFPGTGIGLAIVQRIVYRHGGRIWAEGALDKGAAFSFTLPGQEEHNHR